MVGRQARVGAALVLVAALYQWYCPQVWMVGRVAGRWEEVILLPASAPSRVAVGVNANLDLVVSAVSLLQALNVTPGTVGDSPLLSSLPELGALVGHSMQRCAGVERVFTDKSLFVNTVDTALTLPHSFHVGGNAALIATKMKDLHASAEVMLVGPIGPRLRAVLPPSLSTSSTHTADEVHVIMEYASGDVWPPVTASCANRVIYSHDEANSKMLSLEAFGESVSSFAPDLVILSGAHLLEGQPAAFWEQRLTDIATMLDGIPTSQPVHWELATVGNLKFFRQLADAIFPRIDSLGLNEQELASAAQSHHAPLPGAPSSQPTVRWAADLLHWLLDKYSQSRLTRVHFHSLTFHIVATVEGSRWGNTASAVAAGARVAGLQACDRESFSSAEFEIRAPPTFELEEGSSVTLEALHSWQRGRVRFHLAPVLVCKRPVRTVGLGDAISTAGLLYSTFS